jgi:hypothetical protein
MSEVHLQAVIDAPPRVVIGLTGAQEGTFVDAAAGMDPSGFQYRVFDVLAGRRYFSRWLERSLEAMKRVATNRARQQENRPARG